MAKLTVNSTEPVDGSDQYDDKITDLLIIGGGINGTGIARDATGRGLDVVLCEKDDLAHHTSSSSTKLIHGGLRYLENLDFLLVRHALQEREVLLNSAPHIIWPLRFILPYHSGLRPRWLIRLGLFIYDHIGGRKILPKSFGVNLGKHVAGKTLKSQFKYAFEYSDCWVQDSRFVALNARDARQRGATILTRTQCIELQRKQDFWLATLDRGNGDTINIKTRAIVNAAGPWVKRLLNLSAAVSNRHSIRFIKGSHIIVTKLFDHEYPYIFQNKDNRIVFAIPYERDFTLLGTTDVETDIDPDLASIEDSEIDYICDSVNQYFSTQVKPEDVVWSYSGVRPLFDDASKNASKVTRDYVLQLDDAEAPILSVFGGKITTSRKLSEQVVDMLKQPLGFDAKAWTELATLPGGDMPNADFDAFLDTCAQRYPWLEPAVLYDYARNYGTDIKLLLDNCNSMNCLGEDFGGGLYECEINYLIHHEWALTAEDILWRRTKKGLHTPKGTEKRLQQWLDGRAQPAQSNVTATSYNELPLPNNNTR